MGKYTMDTKLEEIVKDEKAMNILRKNLLFAVNHPRFREAYGYTLNEIINDDMGNVVGIPKSVVKKVIKQILELE
jgi:hypothetical protein